MREDMDLVGRRPNEPLLATALDKNSGEHVFALKEKDKILAVARLQKIEGPLPCFYLRRIETDPSHREQGNASTLMQELTDLLNQHQEVCIAYQSGAEVESILRNNGWRSLPGDKSVYVLNLPNGRDTEASRLIDDILRADFEAELKSRE